MRTREKGFTILEITVAVVMFALLFLVTWQIVGVCADALHANQVATELDSTIQRIYSRVVQEVRESGTDELGTDHVTSHPFTATTNSASITFQMRLNFTGDPVVDWSSLITFALATSPGEIPANGVDDDNDGVVDEQRLTRTQDGKTVILADRVTALNFSRQAGEFQIDFEASVSRAVTKDSELLNRTLTATVALQNKG